ncbi:metallophosphoesterase domain-containing protein 1-like isoform X2 [Ostrea edulis]|uniref:metallophosphoesterase domain-containing protein 1-like isoform X2 n=1 Tax=Ostrea edulis TaxID=37623 RepID=UPI0024AF99B3|nr:metallophosphoesterase domain-containing protein 1-like isoform X2 [Ostrea edulis]XP_055996614.1 metallophosphoesterase domain-containing protein 1-like isoform X2 [Ostrea edulis]
MSEAEEIEVDKDTANPSKAWERIRVHQQYIKGPHLDPSTPITEDKIRFVCISDTHGKIERSPLRMPPGDVLLHAGDFTMTGQIKEIERFDSYLGFLPYKVKVLIGGNHDLTLDEDLGEANLRSFGIQKPEIETYLKSRGIKSVKQMLSHALYLQDSSVSICGIKIYGSPWQPRFGGWGFNVERGKELLRKWQKIPTDTDILISHGPPVGHQSISVGCLFRAVEEGNQRCVGTKYQMKLIY